MFNPNEIDPQRFCKLGQVWEIDSNLSEFPRLVPEFTQGQIFCRVTGREDKHKGYVLSVAVWGQVELICQRCLGSLTHALEIASDVVLARDEADLERRGADSEIGANVILAGAKLSLIELIEDEILLGLPLAPMHPPGVCAIPAVNLKGV